MDDNAWVQWFISYYAVYPWVFLFLCMNGLDILSGTAASIYQGKLSSKVAWKGMMKKALVWIVIGAAYVLERVAINTAAPVFPSGAMPIPIPLSKIMAGFFICWEMLSILENAKRCGVPLPKFLSSWLNNAVQEISTTGVPPAAQTVTVEVKTGQPDPVNPGGTRTIVKTESSATMEKVGDVK